MIIRLVIRPSGMWHMPSDSFQIAAERAAASYPAGSWFTISTSEQAAAIYRELLKLDAESIERRMGRRVTALAGGAPEITQSHY